jgi:hypothetical protein
MNSLFVLNSVKENPHILSCTMQKHYYNCRFTAAVSRLAFTKCNCGRMEEVHLIIMHVIMHLLNYLHIYHMRPIGNVAHLKPDSQNALEVDRDDRITNAMSSNSKYYLKQMA